MVRFYRRLRTRYYTAFLILKLLLPVFLTILTLLILASGAIFYSIIHPEKTLEVISPSDYHMYASDFTWEGANGDVLQGFYIRGSNQAPLIVLCHGYDTNQTEILSLASRLKDYGYNIFLYNNRGHGLSGYHLSSLGLYESIDLKNAIEKLVQKPEIDFRRVGIYGTSLGAYSALTASQGNPNIRALVLDSIYRNIDAFIEMKVKKILGFKTGFISSIVSFFYNIYFGVSPAIVSEEFRPEDFQDKHILFITGSDQRSAALAKETRHLYSTLICENKEIVNLSGSRESLLYGEDKYKYDQDILSYFKAELPLIDVSEEIDLENSPH